MVEGDMVRPHRSAQQPLYLQEYEVSYPQRHLTFADEQVDAVTNADVLTCIREAEQAIAARCAFYFSDNC